MKSKSKLFIYKGKQYRKVKRKAEIGELVMIGNQSFGTVAEHIGEIFEAKLASSTGMVHVMIDDKLRPAWLGEYVVLEPVDKKIKPKVTVEYTVPTFKMGDHVFLRSDYCKQPEFRHFNRKERKLISMLEESELTITDCNSYCMIVDGCRLAIPNTLFLHADKKIKTIGSVFMSGTDRKGKHITEEIPCPGVSKNKFKTISGDATKDDVLWRCPSCKEPYDCHKEPYCSHCGYPLYHNSKEQYEFYAGGTNRKAKQPVSFSKEYCGKAITPSDIREGTETEWFTFSDMHPLKYPTHGDKKGVEDMLGIVPAKRKWTEAEIQESKMLISPYLLNTHFIEYPNEPCLVGAYYLNHKDKHFRCATATCCKYDEFNVHIGRMVACLKLRNKTLPEWINGG
jgi:hypothetical protein